MIDILSAIDKEIERLNTAKALLQGSEPKKKRHTMSRKTRFAIAAAQKKRWADHKKGQLTKA